MPEQITNYQCPACTAPLRYGHESGRLECDYCGSSFDPSEIEELYADRNAKAVFANEETEEIITHERTGEWDMDSTGNEWGVDLDKMRAYNCPSCGAELICEETTAATACPYCNNPTIIPGKFSGAKKPDLVIPFKLDKNDAVEALKRHYKHKYLLPKAFRDNNHIQEIKGIYVPFWLFDANVDTDITFKATRVHTHSNSKENITETDHFLVRRSGSMGFVRIPVDGASKMPDEHMDAIEPFDYRELKPFSLSYLPGFLAEKYDVSQEDSIQRADRRSRASALRAMENTVLGYTTVVPVSQHYNVHPGEVKYALMPVWMLSTQWEGKNFLFAMNGQTGRLVGDLPIDKKKLILSCIGAFLTATAALGWLFL